MTPIDLIGYVGTALVGCFLVGGTAYVLVVGRGR
jgi:hypothetical protein